MAPEELERERIAFALEQGRIAARVALPATLIIAVAAVPGTGIPGAIAWAALMGGVLFARDRMLYGVSELLATPRGLSAARRAFDGSSMALAVGLGLLPALAFPGMGYELRLGLTVFFCCWTCAGMASVGVLPRLYAGFLAVSLGGLAIGWIRSEALQAPYVTGALLLFGLVLRAFSRNIARRITESIAIRAENADLVRQLSEASEAKTRFIMAASHDLRQPLHAISYLGGVLARARDPEDVRSANEALITAVEGLNKLFSAVLDLSRIESGAMRTHRVAFRLDALVAQLDAEYRGLCMASGRGWECRVESAAVLSDPALLERILRNLLDNALKHGGAGLVRLAVAPRGDEVLVTVSDTGPGIPEQERARVFEEFYRAGDAEGQPGLGLGLSIVRRLVQRLGCRLDIDYTDRAAQRGACLTVHVPRAPQPPAGPELPGPRADDAGDVAGLAVLVVDDDETVLHATRVLLAQWECRVASCRTPPQLDAVLAGFGAPDVAIVDYRLDGDVNGLELAAQLRLRYPEMGVVMVTAESGDTVRRQLADSGLPVLEKPVHPRELRHTLSLFRAAAE